MTSVHRATTRKTWALRAGVGGTAAFALVAGGFAVAANAAGPTFTPYDELDSPNPYNVTEGLVFYRGADLGWVVSAPIADVQDLAYTVSDGQSFAPSFQLIAFVDRDGGSQKYTRLVWEPYMQGGSLNPNTGEYTDLEDGLWWTNKIASGPGSQSSPQPLSFFKESGAAGWHNLNVYAVDVHQGTTSDVTSVVTKVSYNGVDIPLGNADSTPFDQDDINDAVDAATGPLYGQISDLTSDLNDAQAEVSSLQGELSDALDDVDDLQGQLAAKQAALTTKIEELAAAQTQLAQAQADVADAQGDLGDAQDDIADLLDDVEGLLAQVADLQDDIDALEDQLSDANAQIDSLQDQLDDAADHAADLEGQLTTAQSNLTATQSSLTASQTSLATALTQLATAQSAATAAANELNAYKANHHTADGTSLGYSRVQLSGTPVHGKTVSAKRTGVIASGATAVKYQWYLNGVAVSGATGSSYKVPSNAKGKTVSVRVTGTYKYMVFSVHSNTSTAK